MRDSGLRRILLVLALTACMVGLSLSGSRPWGAARAETSAEFMPLADVKPGMKGTGKTVVEGTRIDTFDVEVLGVLKGEAATGDLVLVRVSGKPVEAAGGIAAGMSGSPVYVNGRLLGAIAYGYESADHYIGLVTPIEEMLKVFAVAKRPAPGQARLSSPVRLQEQDRIVRRVVLAASPEEAAHLAAERSDETLVMIPVMTPVMTSGILGRALDRLSRKLLPFGLKAVQGGGGGGAQATEGKASLEPGSAIGVQLVRGDVSVTAIGTVTYRKGDEALAFGHSLLGRGNSGYLATGASIHHVVSGDVMPFKVASPLGVAGSIVQDRIHGVLVDLGKAPSTIPVDVTVRDRDTGTARMLRADIVRDEVLATDLAGIFALSCLDAVVNRVGRGTSRVTFEIHGKGLPEPVSRDNMYYSSADISADSIEEMLDYLSAVVDNEFVEVEVTSVKAEFEVGEARRTARIERAEAVTKVVRAGDTVEVKIRLQPFRGIREIKAVQIQIPAETPAGTLYLAVRGGGVPPAEEGAEDSNKSAHPTATESLENLVRELMARERNNDIVVEFYPGEASAGEEAIPVNGRAVPGYPVGSGRLGQSEDLPRREEKPPRGEGAGAGTGSRGLVKSVITTGYVIEGETTVELEIEEAGSESNAQPIP